MPASTVTPVRLLVVSLVLWGGYLALGASGFFQSHGASFNGAKAAIVAACSAAFLALWWMVVRFRRRISRDLPNAPSNIAPSESTPTGSWLALICIAAAWLVAFMPLVIAVASRERAVVFLITNLALWLTGMIAGIVRLSAPDGRSKSVAGYAVLLGIGLAVYVLVTPLIPSRPPSTACRPALHSTHPTYVL